MTCSHTISLSVKQSGQIARMLLQTIKYQILFVYKEENEDKTKARTSTARKFSKLGAQQKNI